ncbi:hypothetical protein Q4534_01570 [Cyclobacterium sp. 1_MG-2023]|uniref:hypothetical protein n=1 Tax=Cyclobacterium sp. 1_MG-2023 TaxID=3062681 RepID=UPI0026E3ECD9|nr:hypothetical protein [Cyclobacterium sp. 1_MG-2023]MDO6436070.1 hypothetical protein [Cyclobacterium sp. 1_MG-2023]
MRLDPLCSLILKVMEWLVKIDYSMLDETLYTACPDLYWEEPHFDSVRGAPWA